MKKDYFYYKQLGYCTQEHYFMRELLIIKNKEFEKSLIFNLIVLGLIIILIWCTIDLFILKN